MPRQLLPIICRLQCMLWSNKPDQLATTSLTSWFAQTHSNLKV
jgi:hypothetical protein